MLSRTHRALQHGGLDQQSLKHFSNLGAGNFLGICAQPSAHFQGSMLLLLKISVWCSLPAQGLLPSSSAEAPLPPHYGTQAVVKAFQTALAASNKQLFGSQTVTLPNITGARQTGIHSGHVASRFAAELYVSHLHSELRLLGACSGTSALLCGCAVEAAYAAALSQGAAALSTAAAPANQLTASLTSQLTVRPHTLYLLFSILLQEDHT